MRENVGVNEVRLRGRLAAPPEARELPAGDRIADFRLVVERDKRATPTLDTIECVLAAPTREFLGLAAGAVVEVEGALRRRFWGRSAGMASRIEVEVANVRISADQALAKEEA